MAHIPDPNQAKPNQPGQPAAKREGFQGGGRTGTPFTPDQDRTDQTRPDQQQSKVDEKRGSQFPGGRTGPGADTVPL